MTQGILLGVDETQEWLLPWWWENFVQENSYPVAVVDFGMTEEKKKWVEERAELIPLASENFVVARANIAQDLEKIWSTTLDPIIWQSRNAWFKKPLALLKSPFDETLWLDLDCEILGPLEPLFASLPAHYNLGMVKEPLIRQGHPSTLLGEVIYNSGVILYRHNRLIERWAEECTRKNDQFWGDQLILSRLIFEENFPIYELPQQYNFQLISGIPLDAVIVHWIGEWGKEFIRREGGLKGITKK